MQFQYFLRSPKLASTSKNETPSGTNMDFAAILRSSLERDIVYKSTCQLCKNLSNHRSRRALSSLHMPPLLAVNAAVNTEDQHKFWLNSGTSKFLKSEVTLPMRDADGVIDPNSAENVTYALRVCASIILLSRRSANASDFVGLHCRNQDGHCPSLSCNCER